MSKFKISDGIVLGSNGIIFSDGSTQTTSTANASNITSGELDSTLLANTGVTAGTYGSSTQVPVIVIDDKGRITSASNTNVEGGGGGGGITYSYKTSNYTASSGEGIIANTVGGAFTVTLPASPSDGDYVEIVDGGDYWGTNNLTVGRNSSTIETFAENLIFDISGASVSLIYGGGTWNVYTQIGALKDAPFSDASLLTTGTLSADRLPSISYTNLINLPDQDLNTTDNVTFAKITISNAPSNSTDATTKSYVDSLISGGVHFHSPVRVESPINLTATYNNGTDGVGATLTNSGTQTALVIDGITMSVNDRVLIYEQTDLTQNGVYVVTDIGSGSTNWILTRATDADSYVFDSPDGLSEGSTFFVQEGATGAGETYTCNTPGTITFGTTEISFVQISSAQIYSAGTGLNLNGVQFSLANTTVTAGTYGDSGNVVQIVIDDQGRITSAANVAISSSGGVTTGKAIAMAIVFG